MLFLISLAIYFPKYIGTINELLAAPISSIEIIIGFISAAVTKSFSIGLIILITAHLFVSINIAHPIFMLIFYPC